MGLSISISVLAVGVALVATGIVGLIYLKRDKSGARKTKKMQKNSKEETQSDIL